MDSSTRERKEALRSEVIQSLSGISAEKRTERSQQACQLLSTQKVWQQARRVLFYAPTAREIDIWPLLGSALAEGKVVSLPRFDSETNEYKACEIEELHEGVQIGMYGIREPGPTCPTIGLNRLDFVLVPGVAFDLHGRRLGRGKGYYDRLLTAVRGRTCGIAFDEQIVREVPVDPHDSDVNCILT